MYHMHRNPAKHMMETARDSWWLNMTRMDGCCFGPGDCGKTSHSLPSEDPPQIL